MQLLRYLSDAPLRARVTAATNKVEQEKDVKFRSAQVREFLEGDPAGTRLGPQVAYGVGYGFGPLPSSRVHFDPVGRCG
ncbi:hypothetical protein [Kitasatospora griseola]|uniref:hypothetical protein n=1 Tax=Kitasatospora griseola TaxID=2064 RepID=UPI00380E1EFF